MPCRGCSINQDKYVCQRCTTTCLARHSHLRQQLLNQINTVKSRCRQYETPLANWRTLRAEVAIQETKVADLKRQLEIKRSDLVPREKFIRPISLDYRREIELVQKKQVDVDQRIESARKVLVKEAIFIYGLKPGEIVGLPLPAPNLMKKQPSIIMNAALLHLCNLFELITNYLYIALPFYPEIQPTSQKILMKANIPFTHTTKYRDPKSQVLHTSRSSKNNPTFYTAYALLFHSISYLSRSQGGEETKDVARNLWSLINAEHLGVKDHMRNVRSLGYGVDVNDVVERVLEECGIKGDQEEWAIVDAG